MRSIKLAASWLLVTTVDFLLWFGVKCRTTYLSVVTFGAWNRLGNFTLDLSDRVDKVEHRLNKFMRFWEEIGGAPLPADIEPPRLTAHGEGLDIWDEAEMVKEEIERVKREPEVIDRPPEGTVSPRPPPSQKSIDEAAAMASEYDRNRKVAEALGLTVDPPKPTGPAQEFDI